MKKSSFIAIMLFTAALPSCTRDYGFTDKSFYGDLSVMDIPGVENEEDISLSFANSNVLVNGTSFPYEVVEDTDEYYLIRIETGDLEQAFSIDFRYTKK
jgi:hypothetical protein